MYNKLIAKDDVDDDDDGDLFAYVLLSYDCTNYIELYTLM